MVATIDLGGIVALCIAFPALVPVFGSVLGWIIGKMPVLAHYLGLVGVRAYARTVTAIQEVKETIHDNLNILAGSFARWPRCELVADRNGYSASSMPCQRAKLLRHNCSIYYE